VDARLFCVKRSKVKVTSYENMYVLLYKFILVTVHINIHSFIYLFIASMGLSSPVSCGLF